MAIPFMGTLIEAGMKVLDRVLPDPAAKREAQLELLKLQQAGEFKQLEADLQLALAQTEINKIEAAAPDLFRGGWRPAIGWICASALAYQMFFRPLLAWFSVIRHWDTPPSLEMDSLLTLLFGMLGLGAYRTYEKVKGAP